MNVTTLTMAFVMGLTGSLHCAGMCGPIMLIMPFQRMKGLKKSLSISLYHFGRISVYAILGLILYFFKASFKPEWQQYISIVLGLLLLIAGVMNFLPVNRWRLTLPWADAVKMLLGNFIANPTPISMLISGMLNGMLPCGLVYMALSTSITAQDYVQALMAMYAFGAGTIPMLLLVTLLKGRIVFLRINNVRKAVPTLMLVFGFLFIIRGMNLGVPYLSPKISIEKEAIRTSCCHKH